MNKYLAILLVLLVSSCCEEHIEDCPCTGEQQNPIYKACGDGTVYGLGSDCQSSSGMISQLYSVLKYPQEALQDSVQGRVMIAFEVYEDGSMGNYTVVQDTLGHGLADAAIAALMTLNEKGFCPARDNCEPVVFNFIFPVLFVLQ